MNIVGNVLAVSVGRPKQVTRGGRPAETAIWKNNIEGRIRASGVNLEGDEQSDRQGHGGFDKAIYAYGEHDRLWWESELGRPIPRGGFGENLTIEGTDITNAVVGERWRIGSVLVEVSEPRVPCWKLNLVIGEDRFIQRFNAAGRPGTYLRIIEAGVLGPGDQVAVVSRPSHGVTIGAVSEIYQKRAGAERLLAVDELSEAWKAWARRTIARRGTDTP